MNCCFCLLMYMNAHALHLLHAVGCDVIELVGRRGDASFINGICDRRTTTLNGRPVYKVSYLFWGKRKEIEEEEEEEEDIYSRRRPGGGNRGDRKRRRKRRK